MLWNRSPAAAARRPEEDTSLFWIGIAIAILMWTIGGALLWYAIDRPLTVMGTEDLSQLSARRSLGPVALTATFLANGRSALR